MFDFLPRILWHYFFALFRPSLSILDTFSSSIRVWPILDTDGFRFFAVPRYISIAAIIIWAHTIRSGFVRFCFRHKWVFVTKRQQAQFYKPIKIFSRCTVKTKPVTWGEFSIIRRVEFFQEEKLCAIMYMQIYCLSPGRGKISMDEMFDKVGLPDARPGDWPEAVASWKENRS